MGQSLSIHDASVTLAGVFVVNFLCISGRGFVQARRPLDRAGFERGRIFHPRGRGRTGSHDFGGRRPFRGRGHFGISLSGLFFFSFKSNLFLLLNPCQIYIVHYHKKRVEEESSLRQFGGRQEPGTVKSAHYFNLEVVGSSHINYQKQ